MRGWASSGEFTEMVFEDEFIGNDMRPEWRWEDPQGGGSWSERQGYLEMRTDPGQDLWHGPNGRGGDMSAPRLLMEVSEDFAIETRMRISPQLREHGGLIIWKMTTSSSDWKKLLVPTDLEEMSVSKGMLTDVSIFKHAVVCGKSVNYSYVLNAAEINSLPSQAKTVFIGKVSELLGWQWDLGCESDYTPSVREIYHQL